MTPQQRAKSERTATVLAKAAQKSQDGVVQALAVLKVNMSNTLDTIANSVSAELATLKEVQEAVEAKKAELKELHGIEAQANTIVELKQREEADRHSWAVDAAEIQKQRDRDEEQYQYELAKKHRDQEEQFKSDLKSREDYFVKRSNEWTAKLEAREAAVAAQEQELVSLRAKVAAFDEQLKREVDRAVAIATNSLKKELTNEHKIELMGKDNNLSMKAAESNTLRTQLADLGERFAQLEAKYQQASDKVQEIAEKAIEGAAQQKVVVQPATEYQNGRK